MEPIHAVQTVNGPTLIIPVPPELDGKRVEIVVTPVEVCRETPEERHARRIKEATLEKPAVSADLRQRLLDDPDLLKPDGYDDPFGPACPPEDWEALA